MVKSFGHQAVRLRCRFLINHCLILAFVALPVASAFVIFPSAAAAQAECDCSNLKALQAELRNALRLQQAFRNKIAELRTMKHGTSVVAMKQFSAGEARRGFEPVPGYKGPSEVDYYPWGRDLHHDRTGTTHTAEKLCSVAVSATAALNAAVAASACSGIGKALRAHEEVHHNFCRTIGFIPYEDMHGADRAKEEVEAYGAQIKVLRALLDSLRCGFRVTAISRWHVPGPANLNIVADIKNTGMTEVGEGLYKGTASVTWVITSGQVGDCIPQSVTTSSQAKLIGQVYGYGPEEVKVSVDYEAANISLPAYCVGSDGSIGSGSTPVQMTPDLVTLTVPASGGAEKRLSQVLEGPEGPISGSVVIIVTQVPG